MQWNLSKVGMLYSGDLVIADTIYYLDWENHGIEKSYRTFL